MLNWGGDWGSHLHRLGVHVTKFQQALAQWWSLIFAKRPFSLLLPVEAESLASSGGLLFFPDPTFGSESVGMSSALSTSDMVLEEGF